MSFIPKGVTRTVASGVLNLKQKSPGLLLVGGIAGFAATTVLSSRATLKVDAVLEDIREAEAKIDSVPVDYTNPETGESYTQQDRYRDKAIVKFKLVLELGKLYGPAILVGSASIAMLVGSHQILNRRNASLMAAYAAVDKAFRSYRERVAKDLGVDKEREFYRDVTKERVTETNPETGRKVTKEVSFATGGSPYAVTITNSNVNNHGHHTDTLTFLRLVQSYSSEKLMAKGYLTLNDVYKELGVDETSAGAVVGWVYGSGGDDYVDFGIFSSEDPHALHNFLTDPFSDIVLDFNVDGVIFDKIDEVKARKKAQRENDR